jgi:hypothetical protein
MGKRACPVAEPNPGFWALLHNNERIIQAHDHLFWRPADPSSEEQ